MTFTLSRRTILLYKTLRSAIHFDHISTITRICPAPHQKRLISLVVNHQSAKAMTESKDTRTSMTVFQTPTSAVLRYTVGDERFQLKLIHNKKIFNFDRSTSDSLESLISRMVANMSKKLKSWDGAVSLLTSQNGGWTEVLDKTIPVSTLLQEIKQGNIKLNIKISEDVYDVVLNPPEVFSIKFLKQAIAGFPLVPHKIDASCNFNLKASKYMWEFTRESKTPVNISKKKTQNNKSQLLDAGGNWLDTGCSEFIFTPGEDLIGARLRLTFFPSDGNCFGLPFSEELPDCVSSIPVDRPLFMERLCRMQNNGPTDVERKDPNFLRVVSYNCLAECYATEEWFIASPKSALPADFRLPFLCKEFSSYQSDVYCLQEIEDKYFERLFTPFFEYTMGYNGYFSSKTGSVKEGVAIFYNPKKLECIKNETVAINEHLRTMTIWDQLPSSIVDRVEERNSVLQVSIFKSKAQENTVVIIANTHLYFHPDADHIRLLQTIACVDYIEIVSSELEKNFEGYTVNVLFCGDFNCTPPFSSFRYLTSGKIDCDDFDWTSHPTQKLESGLSLKHKLKFTNSHPDFPLTNITTCFEGCIDYILYQSQHFERISIYPPPDKTTLAELCNVSETRLVSLPNLYTPSDHLPLIADFRFRSK